MADDSKPNAKTSESFIGWLRNHFPQDGGYAKLSVAEEMCNIGPVENADCYGKICGICGDTMEIWLRINDGVISEARFLTDGCFSSQLCGAAATYLAKNETLMDALRISPASIMDLMSEMEGVELHCSILATSALYRAIADYILKINGETIQSD
ncbi:MAG: iron-sulfur cluster assembly scaffold protein [bacterium]